METVVLALKSDNVKDTEFLIPKSALFQSTVFTNLYNMNGNHQDNKFVIPLYDDNLLSVESLVSWMNYSPNTITCAEFGEYIDGMILADKYNIVKYYDHLKKHASNRLTEYLKFLKENNERLEKDMLHRRIKIEQLMTNNIVRAIHTLCQNTQLLDLWLDDNDPFLFKYMIERIMSHHLVKFKRLMVETLIENEVGRKLLKNIIRIHL